MQVSYCTIIKHALAYEWLVSYIYFLRGGGRGGEGRGVVKANQLYNVIVGGLMSI